MPNIICADADFSAVAVDFYDPTIVPDALKDHIYGLYFFGSSMPMPDGWDYSGNERHLTRIGATPAGALYQPVNQSDYYLTPFTGDAAIAAGTANELTIFGITKAAAGSVIASSQDLTLTRPFVGLNTVASSSAVAARQSNGVTTAIPAIASNAHRGTFPEFLAGTYSASAAKAYREYPTYAQATASAAPPAAPSTNGFALRIGALFGTGTSTIIGDANISCAGIADRVLTATELHDLYTSLHDWLALKSGSFWS